MSKKHRVFLKLGKLEMRENMKYNYINTVEYLLDWYDNNARILPWRSNPEPYYIWISEIMLQQTRVEAVKTYFERFIHVLPDVRALADVEEDKLLKLWEGLGYYNRARNLKKAARMVVSEYGGTIPSDYVELIKLPGIGSYTAGAITSIAFGNCEPAVDGNVLRVMKRIAGSFDDITNTKIKKELEDDLRAIIPRERPGDFNQAVMELGALVCIPNGKPLCDQCPCMHLCQAFHHNTEMQIPVKPSKKPRKIEDITVFIIENNDNYLIRKRKDTGLLNGLWEFPNINRAMSYEEALTYLGNGGLGEYNIGYEQIAKVEEKGKEKHIFTHLEWHMSVFKIIIGTDNIKENSFYGDHSNALWAQKNEINEIYSLPSAFGNVKKYL